MDIRKRITKFGIERKRDYPRGMDTDNRILKSGAERKKD